MENEHKSLPLTMTRVDLPLFKADNSVMVLADVEVPKKFYNKILFGIQALDEIFGGTEAPGIVDGSSCFFTGVPGSGKSTLALQMADALTINSGLSVVYNLGEENPYMVKMRADRIGLKNRFSIGQKVEVDDLMRYCVKEKIRVLFQDSLQSLRDGHLSGPSKLKSIAKKLQSLSKDDGITTVIIGHSTKTGQFAGPQEIKHDFDIHAHLTLNRESGNRIMNLEKNRVGPACVPYEFSLSAHGLDFQVAKSLPPEDGKSAPKGAGRREEIKNIIKKKLAEGEKISGYCFDRLSVDCSGGFWRGMLAKAVQELTAEGHKMAEIKIHGRTHSFMVMAS